MSVASDVSDQSLFSPEEEEEWVANVDTPASEPQNEQERELRNLREKQEIKQDLWEMQRQMRD
eukprot:1411552-Alexandrium_andersonii.AAC.1